jgi:hypothetical protein
VVDENQLYRLRGPGGEELVRLGSELVAGVVLKPGEWVVEKM